MVGKSRVQNGFKNASISRQRQSCPYKWTEFIINLILSQQAISNMPAQWIIETLVPSIYAGVFQCRVSRGRVFNFLATVSSWAWLTPERSAPLGINGTNENWSCSLG